MDRLVSVCLLVYNHGKYINECLKSLMNQTYNNIELLIIDDASTDDTCPKIYDTMEELKCVFNRVLLIRNSSNSCNISKNFNALIKESKGKYIKGFSGDDIMHPQCIEKLVKYLEENRDEILCYSNMYIVDDDYSLKDSVPYKTWFINHAPLQKNKVFNALMKNNYIPSPTVLSRRIAYEKYGLYDEKIHYEDYDMFLHLSRVEKFGYISDKLVFYRRAADSISNIRKWKDKRKMLFSLSESSKVIKKHLKYINKNDRKEYIRNFYSDYIKRTISNRYFDIALVLIFEVIRRKYINVKEVIQLIKEA